VKDNIDVAGFPTTAACPAFQHMPARSAPTVQALLDAGAPPARVCVGALSAAAPACGAERMPVHVAATSRRHRRQRLGRGLLPPPAG
jgi:Asp-tRNA(Asn)/Glu-tRNA(Gln) amidotransferase A subunit family amidase